MKYGTRYTAACAASERRPHTNKNIQWLHYSSSSSSWCFPASARRHTTPVCIWRTGMNVRMELNVLNGKIHLPFDLHWQFVCELNWNWMEHFNWASPSSQFAEMIRWFINHRRTKYSKTYFFFSVYMVVPTSTPLNVYAKHNMFEFTSHLPLT